MCVMLLIVVLGVLLFVREKPSDEKPAEEGVFHIPGIVGVGTASSSSQTS